MLKCPACGRAGGPFRLGSQIHADSQVIRAWACPCGHTFYACGGAERAASAQPPYNGFTLEWNGRSQSVRLQHISKHESLWKLATWSIRIEGPSSGPGTRVVSLLGVTDEPEAEWRLEPGWGPAEVGRRIRLRPVPDGVDPDLLARVIVRLLV
ncbi:MAG TPA: hypothetical protein VD902_07475 [Symbiobacteriaceae bacterium]|nr:hypothetical protein [Symbiobacteriaceae bacterium]